MNESILTFLACICFIFLIGRIFVLPLKWLLKLVLNSIIGGLIIFAINLIGGIWGVHIGLNVFTAILVGILGLPGAIILIIAKIFF